MQDGFKVLFYPSALPRRNFWGFAFRLDLCIDSLAYRTSQKAQNRNLLSLQAKKSG